MARKRKARVEESGGDDNFAVMFASLNLILLCFFVLLNSIAVRDNARVRRAIGSLRGTFGILEGGENLVREGKQFLRTDPIFSGSGSGMEIEQDLDVLLRRARDRDIGAKHTVRVRTADGIGLAFLDTVPFLPGSVDIDPRLFPLLDGLAGVIQRHKVPVRVRGYADPTPPRRFPSNTALSAARAVRVARYLVEAGGVPAERVRAEGMGTRRPAGADRRLVEVVVPTAALERPLKTGGVE